MGRFKLHKVSRRCCFVGAPAEHRHTVVFVHGLSGGHLSSWDKFPALIKTDVEMPSVNVLCWGYRSHLFLPFGSDTQTLGKNLAATLTLQMGKNSKTYLVGHSLGGLVIFESLVGQFRRGRAQEAPNRGISQITLFASPVNGSSLAKLVKDAFGRYAWASKLVNRQIRSLARGSHIDSLFEEVRDRIFMPKSESSNRRKIPIRMIMATRDRYVDEEDRDAFKAMFDEVAALELDYSHNKIKSPRQHLDDRYKALANDLKDRAAEDFGELCQAWVSSSGRERFSIDVVFDKQYGKMVREKFEGAGGDVRDRRLFEAFEEVVKRHGALGSTPCHVAVTQAVMEFNKMGHLPSV